MKLRVVFFKIININKLLARLIKKKMKAQENLK